MSEHVIHPDAHPLAGKTVKLYVATPTAGGRVPAAAPLFQEVQHREFVVEDWQDRVFGKSWQHVGLNANPAVIDYAMRVGLTDLPIDDDVLYGKVGNFWHLVHSSELGEVIE
jgi:hypothetical protein